MQLDFQKFLNFVDAPPLWRSKHIPSALIISKSAFALAVVNDIARVFDLLIRALFPYKVLYAECKENQEIWIGIRKGIAEHSRHKIGNRRRHKRKISPFEQLSHSYSPDKPPYHRRNVRQKPRYADIACHSQILVVSHVQRGVVYIVGMIQIKSFAKPRHLLYYGNRPLPKPKSSRACGAVVSAASAAAAVSRREYALDIFEELNVRTPHIRPAEHLYKQRYQA